MNPAAHVRRKRACPMNEWISVESSNIAEVKYEPTQGFLWVKFHAKADGGTGIYCYVAVPAFRFRNLVRATSVGQYFHQHVNRKYSTLKEITL